MGVEASTSTSREGNPYPKTHSPILVSLLTFTQLPPAPCDFVKLFMEPQSQVASSPATRVKASMHLGSETCTVHGSTCILLSAQLASMKEESMSIFKDYITKHNAPADVPDEPLEGSSGEEDEIPDKPKSKKRK